MVVVMDQGQIEQAASARDVYDKPRSGYVARFMGGQNVLSGTVLSREANSVTIKTGAKLVALSAPSPAPATGSAFEAAVRRDHIRLRRAESTGGQPGVNAVTGRVAGIEYQGTWLKITIDEACGEAFVVNLPDSVFFADPLTIGEPVLARWDADKVHFLDSGAKASAGSAQAGLSEMATLERR
jgi:putative spermidine/putrescine transport system ATP-binding protein